MCLAWSCCPLKRQCSLACRSDVLPSTSSRRVAARLGIPISCVQASCTEGSFSERFDVNINGQRWFAKTLPSDADALDICTQVGLFEREQHFLGAVEELMRSDHPFGPSLRLPRLLHSTKGLLVEEHFCNAGFVPCHPAKPLKDDEFRLALTALAEFHACLPCEMPGINPRQQWGQYGVCVSPLVEAGIAKLKDGGDLKMEVIARLERGQIVETLMTYPEHPIVMCHGDCWVANLLLHPTAGQAALVDFQFVGPSCAADDVLVLMLTSLDPDLRRAQEMQFLEYYMKSYVTAQRRLGSLDMREVWPFERHHLRHGAALAAVVILADLELYPWRMAAAALEDIAELLSEDA